MTYKNKTMRNFLFTFLLSLATSSAFAGKKPSTKLYGEITNSPTEWVFLRTYLNNDYITIDSAKINKKGKFKLNVKTGAANFYSLYFTDDEFLLLILDSTASKVYITSDGVNMNQNYKIEGSKDSELVQSFLATFFDYKTHTDSLNMLLYSNKSTYAEKEALKVKVAEASKKFENDRNNFIKQNASSLSVLTVLSYLKPSQDLEYYKIIEKGIGEKYPNSDFHIAVQTQVKQIETQLELQAQQKREQEERIKRSSVGSLAPELGFKSPDGKKITLESLRGKYVLIDFWASWCRPCRMENPNVVRLYNKYKDKGFTVYSVSLDKRRDRWLKAIEQDGLVWPNHVSDLKQWQSEAVQIYNFRGIPHTVLLNPDGVIIEKNLRGKSLEDKLVELFGE